jgi:hypothetical protein
MSGALAADTLDVKLDENGTSFLEVRSCYMIGMLCMCNRTVAGALAADTLDVKLVRMAPVSWR